ncbi:MAG: hypothetical protein AAB821_01385, partial [Patescibacteria group bacterium]
MRTGGFHADTLWEAPLILRRTVMIVLLSRSENIHSDAVVEGCGEHADVVRVNFDFDQFSVQGFSDVVLGNLVGKKTVRSVFVHHPRVTFKDEWFEDDIERKIFVASWDSFKEWMEFAYPYALWVNRPSSTHKSRNILGQLSLASSLGLSVPPTLFTNSLKELRGFSTGGRVVIKQGNLGVNLDGKRILTSLVDVDSISEDILKGCPCLFQLYTPKKYELRIHVIGDEVLACKIDSQKSEKTRIDWRNFDIDNTPHEPFKLHSSVRDVCIKLVRQLGLGFGIIDMVVSPTGEYVFLECNAQGHWIWVEELTELP